MIRVLRGVMLTVVVLFVLALLGTGIEQLAFSFIFHGLFGWLVILITVVPMLPWNGSIGVSMALGVAVLALGLHHVLAWLARSWQKGRPDAVPWRGVWTVSLLALVLIACTAGIAMVGATHQLAWLGSPSSRWHDVYWYSLRRHAVNLVGAIVELRKQGKPVTTTDLEALRRGVDSDIRVVAMRYRDDGSWLVAVGPFVANDPHWKHCTMATWREGEQDGYPRYRSFPGDRWQELIAAAEAGQDLTKF